MLALLGVAGCYRSHLRAGPGDGSIDAPAPDAASVDAARVDAASSDAARMDAGPVACDALAVTGMVSLDEGVTPRLVALPGDDVGVVYVRTDGDPTRVVYERLDRSLARVTGPVTVGTDAFTWAELATLEGEVLIAYGLAGDRESMLVHVSFDGARTGRQHVVPLAVPSIFQASAAGDLLWGAFEMRTENSLVLAHVTTTGELPHAAVTIPLGRYGSGHHALAQRDGSHVLGYSREGPPGSRHGYVRTIARDGTLGEERPLDPDGSDRSVIPVRVGSELVVVRESETLVLERTDPETLERLDRVELPPLAGRPIAGSLAGRLVVAHATSGVFRWDFFASDLSGGDRYELATPDPALGTGTSVVEQPGALVFAIGLTSGASSRPWVVRIACL